MIATHTKTLSAAVIVGDNTYAGLATILSLLNQTEPPDELVILENPLKGRRLTVEFPLLSSILAYHFKTISKVVSTQNVRLPDARQLCEDSMTFSLYTMISDGDHYYPSDYVETALNEFRLVNIEGYYGGAVECNTSATADLLPNAGKMLLDCTHDYVAGGSHIYSSKYRGLWDTVGEFTEGLGEDRFWRSLCVEQGGRRIGTYPKTIHHTTIHSSVKYPQSWNPQLVAHCEKFLGIAKHTDNI